MIPVSSNLDYLSVQRFSPDGPPLIGRSLQPISLQEVAGLRLANNKNKKGFEQSPSLLGELYTRLVLIK